jgi:CBS domain containing-hemolysin-like protein
MEGSTAAVVGLAAASGALLVVRAVMAALEAALVAVGMPRAQELAEETGAGRRARDLGKLFADPESTAFTMRSLVTFATVFASLFAAAAGATLLPGAPFAGAAAFAAVAALVSILFAAVGRGLGAAHGERFALSLASPVLLARTLLRPAGVVLRAVAGRAARFSLPRPPLEEMERTLAEEARSQGAGSEATTELIHAVFAFREKVAEDVMVPRTDVVAIDIDTPVPDILRILAEEGHSRLPVYRGTLDHITGVLHARDLVPMLTHPEIIVLRDILRPAHFVPWTKRIDQLLREMQRRRLHMAFVVDEYGGVMGICTLEDVLEQIVGEIGDEFEEDEASRPVEANADGTFTVQGFAGIAEFNRAADADLPEDEGFETVAGFLNALAGAIPSKGEKLTSHGWVFTVAECDPRKVTKVRAARLKRA